MAKKSLEKPVPGRPRNSEATTAILDAALALTEEVGFSQVSIEGIATRAGVAKTTIYRRWNSVGAIVLDAFLAEVSRQAPIEMLGSVRESVTRSLKLLAKAFRGRHGDFVRQLLGQTQFDEALNLTYREHWVEPRREAARAVVRQGVQSGELRKDLDVEVMLDALYGALYYRLLVPYAPITDAYVDKLVDHVFRGLEA